MKTKRLDWKVIWEELEAWWKRMGDADYERQKKEVQRIINRHVRKLLAGE